MFIIKVFIFVQHILIVNRDSSLKEYPNENISRKGIDYTKQSKRDQIIHTTNIEPKTRKLKLIPKNPNNNNSVIHFYLVSGTLTFENQITFLCIYKYLEYSCK